MDWSILYGRGAASTDRPAAAAPEWCGPGLLAPSVIGWTTTGDSFPTYANFRAHTRAMLNLTLSGFSNVGQDIGGWDSREPTALCALVCGRNVLSVHVVARPGRPRALCPRTIVESAARQFSICGTGSFPTSIRCIEAAHRTGIPMFRSFPLQESSDPLAFRIDDQFFVGDDLLVAPIFQNEGDRDLYLPPGCGTIFLLTCRRRSAVEKSTGVRFHSIESQRTFAPERSSRSDHRCSMPRSWPLIL